MGQWSVRRERFEKILRQIMADGDYCLIPHITSIDPSYYTRELKPDETSSPRDPHPLFDSAYYREVYLAPSYTKHPFCHFMTRGYTLGYKPSAYFDYDVYGSRTGWDKSQGNPLRHYLRDHRHSLSSPGTFFDRAWYCDKTPTLHDQSLNTLIQYRLFGTREEKSPVPVFDPHFYLAQLAPDKKKLAARDPFSHYASSGIASDIKPCEWFDPKYYKEKHQKELGALSPLEHYLQKGVFEGCCPDSRIDSLTARPVISIVVPVYNAEPHYLNNCIRSVLYQSYPYWELCLADDGSSRQETLEQLEYWKQLGDARIKVTCHETNKGISAATNSAAGLAAGEYIGFLDNDDELSPDCLFHTAERIGAAGAELIYTDEDLIGDDGRRHSLFFKPDFNLALLLSHNYITHFVAVSRKIFDKCGGLNSTCDGAQDFDFLLRAAGLTDKIEHIPRILYHWRAAKTSVSVNNDQKLYAHNAGKTALENSLKSRKLDGSVGDTELNFFYRLHRTLGNKQPLVTVLVWNGSGDRHGALKVLHEIRRSAGYENFELVLLTGTPEHSDPLTESEQTIFFPAGKNKAQSLDLAVAAGKGDYIVLLDSSLKKLQDRWLHELVSTALAERVNIVCGQAEYSNEPASFDPVPDLSRTDFYYYYKFLHTASLHHNGLHCTQYVTLPTADLCLFSKALYSRTNGFDHASFPEVFPLADLAFRAAEMGQDVWYTPYAHALYPARPFAAADSGSLALEKELFQKKWRQNLRKIDKYYNAGILLENGIDPDRFIRWQAGG